MGRAVKWIAIGFGALIAIAAAVVGYVAATFDPNDYKESIVQAVRDKTGRTLVLQGDLALSLFPSIGAKIGKASLSEPKSTRQFAAISSALVSVKLLPLFSKQVIVDAIDLKGLRLNVERTRSGRMNFEDLTGAEGAEKTPADSEKKPDTPVKVDIASVKISDADVTYSDEAAGTRYRLSKLDLETGRVANGVATPVDLSATIASEKDKAQLDARLETMLTFDLGRELYKLDKLALSAKGRYADITGLDAAVKGNIEVRAGSGEYLASALAAAIKGKRPDGDFDLKLDAPTLVLTRDKIDGGKLAIDARSSDGKGKLVAKVRIGSVTGAFSNVKAAPLDADIEAQGAGRAFRARLNGALAANLDKKTAGLNFSGKIDESNVKGQAAVTRFSPLALAFDLDADQLDADRLLGKAPAPQAPSGKAPEPKPAKPEKPAAAPKDDKIDLSALKGVDASGKIRIGRLTLLNLKSSEVRAAIKVAGGRLDIAPMSAQLYQGTLAGSLSAQAADNPVFAVRQTLNGVAIGPLLRDAAQIDTLEGKGTVQADLTTRGATVQALKKALNGTAAVNLADGSVKGVDIAGTIQSVRSKIGELRGQPVQRSNKTEKTDFTELKASFKITNGVARNNDLAMKSPLLRLEGAGDIDIGDDRMNYLLKATLVATSRGQGGRDTAELAGVTVPVRLTGALASPQWSIDFAGMASDLAQKRLQDEILKRIPGSAQQPDSGGSIEGTIKDRLKGIFGR
ncbi:MAG: AsmA family protein [Betaproteobacteria bacterium]|nr:MAG: AsmA family protein [Betaproteobacteria bacterium]